MKGMATMTAAHAIDLAADLDKLVSHSDADRGYYVLHLGGQAIRKMDTPH